MFGQNYVLSLILKDFNGITELYFHSVTVFEIQTHVKGSSLSLHKNYLICEYILEGMDSSF